MTDEPENHPLVDEAMKKASVAWVAVAGDAPLALWCVPLEAALFVVSAPGSSPRRAWPRRTRPR